MRFMVSEKEEDGMVSNTLLSCWNGGADLSECYLPLTMRRSPRWSPRLNDTLPLDPHLKNAPQHGRPPSDLLSHASLPMRY